MTKKEYLKKLEEELDGLSKEEKNSALKYYEDYFEDAGIENESEVIKELGFPENLAKIIKGEKEEKNIEDNTTNPFPIWLIILLILFSPIALPLIIGLLGTLFGLFMGFIGVLIGFLTAGAGIFIAGIALTTIGIFKMFTFPLSGMLITGIGLILLGIGILLTMVSIKICVYVIPAFIKGIVNLFSNIFRRRK